LPDPVGLQGNAELTTAARERATMRVVMKSTMTAQMPIAAAMEGRLRFRLEVADAVAAAISFGSPGFLRRDRRRRYALAALPLL
jgi:hypothetical protein